jgi:hypothetical protein
MMLLIVRLLDLVNALLDHFVNGQYGEVEDYTVAMFWQSTDYQWQGDIASVLTPKGNETFGALATIIHQSTMFLAMLLLLLNRDVPDPSHRDIFSSLNDFQPLVWC